MISESWSESDQVNTSSSRGASPDLWRLVEPVEGADLFLLDVGPGLELGRATPAKPAAVLFRFLEDMVGRENSAPEVGGSSRGSTRSSVGEGPRACEGLGDTRADVARVSVESVGSVEGTAPRLGEAIRCRDKATNSGVNNVPEE